MDCIAKCHAILFVLSATEQLGQNEREYLETRIQGRGLTVFFLINGWDKIIQNLLYPTDQKIADAEEKIRKRFKPILKDYLERENKNDYEKWVFEISAIQALRHSTGFPEFTKNLGSFLNNDRFKSELYPAVKTSQSTRKKVQQAIERQRHLLGKTVKELEVKIKEVEPGGATCKLKTLHDKGLSRY